MSDLGWRLAVVLSVLAAAALVILVMRSRDSATSRKMGNVDMEPGIYLFTSTTCLDCAPVREVLDDKLGRGRYTEIEWENDPDVFGRLAIDEVPVAVRVDDSGRATMYKGDFAPMFSGLDP